MADTDENAGMPEDIYVLLDSLSRERNNVNEADVETFMISASRQLRASLGRLREDRLEELREDMARYLEPISAQQSQALTTQLETRAQIMELQQQQDVQQRREVALLQLSMLANQLLESSRGDMTASVIRRLLPLADVWDGLDEQIDRLLLERYDPMAAQLRLDEMEHVLQRSFDDAYVAAQRRNKMLLQRERYTETVRINAELDALQRERQMQHEDYLDELTADINAMATLFLTSLRERGGEEVNPGGELDTPEGREQLFQEFQAHLQTVAQNRGLVEPHKAFERSTWRQVALNNYRQGSAVLGLLLLLPDLRFHVRDINEQLQNRNAENENRNSSGVLIEELANESGSRQEDEREDDEREDEQGDDEGGNEDGEDDEREDDGGNEEGENEDGGNEEGENEEGENEDGGNEEDEDEEDENEELYLPDGNINMCVPVEQRFTRHYANDLRLLEQEYDLGADNSDLITEQLQHTELWRRRLAMFAAAFFKEGDQAAVDYYRQWSEGLADADSQSEHSYDVGEEYTLAESDIEADLEPDVEQVVDVEPQVVDVPRQVGRAQTTGVMEEWGEEEDQARGAQDQNKPTAVVRPFVQQPTSPRQAQRPQVVPRRPQRPVVSPVRRPVRSPVVSPAVSPAVRQGRPVVDGMHHNGVLEEWSSSSEDEEDVRSALRSRYLGPRPTLAVDHFPETYKRPLRGILRNRGVLGVMRAQSPRERAQSPRERAQTPRGVAGAQTPGVLRPRRRFGRRMPTRLTPEAGGVRSPLMYGSPLIGQSPVIGPTPTRQQSPVIGPTPPRQESPEAYNVAQQPPTPMRRRRRMPRRNNQHQQSE